MKMTDAAIRQTIYLECIGHLKEIERSKTLLIPMRDYLKGLNSDFYSDIIERIDDELNGFDRQEVIEDRKNEDLLGRREANT